MKYTWNDEDLSQAFIDFGKEKGTTLYKETTDALAKEIRDKVNSGLELSASIKETIAQLFPKEENSPVAHPIENLKIIRNKINHLLTKLAGKRKPITPQEIEAWRMVIKEEIYVPFEAVGQSLSAELRRAMDYMAAQSQKKAALMEFRDQVQAQLMQTMENQSNGKATQVTVELPTLKKYFPNWQKNAINSAKVASYCRGELRRIGIKLAQLTTEINKTHVYAIGITGTRDYIKHDFESPDKFTTVAGFQGYLEDMGFKIDYISEALHNIEEDNRMRGKKGDAKWIAEHEFTDLQTNKSKNPIWDQRSISNNRRKFAQIPVLKTPGLWTVTMEQFMGSLTYEVMQKMMQQNIANGADPTKEKQKLEDALKMVSVMIDQLNKRENTWQKGMAIYRLLDPAIEQTITMATTLMNPGKGLDEVKKKLEEGEEPEYKDEIENTKTPGTIAPLYLTKEDLTNPSKLRALVSKYSRNFATFERKWGEGQNIDAHWSVLNALSGLQKRGEQNPKFLSGGQQFYEEAIKANPSLAGNKDLERAARKIDIAVLSEVKMTNLANVIFNPATPDWLLMKIASVGFEMQKLTEEEKKGLDPQEIEELNDFENQYRYMRKAAYQVLKSRGWEARRLKGAKKVARETRGQEALREEIKAKNPDITEEELEAQMKQQSTTRKTYGIIFQRRNPKDEEKAARYKVIYKKADKVGDLMKKKQELEKGLAQKGQESKPLQDQLAVLQKQIDEATKEKAQIDAAQQAAQAQNAAKDGTPSPTV